MSYFSFKPEEGESSKKTRKTKGSVRKAFSDFLIKNYGDDYVQELKKQRSRKQGTFVKSRFDKDLSDEPLVGIIGGGFAGMYAGLILQSLGIEFEIYESTDRVGGRIDTWYSTKYDANNKDSKGLYGEVGGMRVPQFSLDMLPVQQLSIAVNTVLERNGLKDKMVKWRKFYYNSDVQRLRYNNMEKPIEAVDAPINSLNFGKNEGGDLDMVWITEKEDDDGKPYLPINKILDKVNEPFISEITADFEKGFAKLMKFDNYSMWAYLTNVFQLKELGDYYDEAMGKPDDYLSYNVASYLETLNVGTGMYSVSFAEIVIAVYDWSGSKNSYDQNDDAVYMVTVDNGMQHLPNACKAVLDLEKGVQPTDGIAAQQLVGMIKGTTGTKGYSPSNLTEDAQPPSSVREAHAIKPKSAPPSTEKKRVMMNNKVLSVDYKPEIYDGHGGMSLTIERPHSKNGTTTFKKRFPYVISTLPNGAYLSGELKTNFFDNLSFAKARAIRECNYMPSFKAFITFNDQFWAKLGKRQDKGLGVGTSDRANRQIVYPSYGYEANGGVLQIYCWAQDAERMGALDDEARVNECLKGIQFLYPEIDIYESFAGYKPEENTKTWFWDSHAGGGAFALFAPGQFKSLYPTLLTPEFDGCLNLAGECCSVHHGWIVGALDSAYNAVNNILQQSGQTDKIKQMQDTWGGMTEPDVQVSKRPNVSLVS